MENKVCVNNTDSINSARKVRRGPGRTEWSVGIQSSVRIRVLLSLHLRNAEMLQSLHHRSVKKDSAYVFVCFLMCSSTVGLV